MKKYPTRSSPTGEFQRRERGVISFEEYQQKGLNDLRQFDASILATLSKEPSEWDGWDESKLILRQKELSADTVETAIRRGQILKRLRLLPDDYETKKIGITAKTGFKLINLATSPRMYRTDWQRPCTWRACYEIVKYDARNGRYKEVAEYRYAVDERIFKAVTRPPGDNHQQDNRLTIGYNSTRTKVLEAIAAYRNRFQSSTNEEESAKPKAHQPAPEFENQILCGNCLDLIPSLPDRSIDLVLTSPPYADQREGHYPGVPESMYVEWFCKVMTAIRPKLANDGSVLIVIRAPEANGRVNPYVLRTRLALQDIGWFEPQELKWIKPDGPPLGSLNRLRRSWEDILWFAKDEPFVDLTTGGRKTKKKGFQDKDPHGLYGTKSAGFEVGTARKQDYFTACVNEVDKDVNHPAIYPPTLVQSLVETFSRPGSIILDPFVGSGTTALVARRLGRKYVGFDIEQKFVDLTNNRLTSDRRYRAVAV